MRQVRGQRGLEDHPDAVPGHPGSQGLPEGGGHVRHFRRRDAADQVVTSRAVAARRQDAPLDVPRQSRKVRSKPYLEKPGTSLIGKNH